MLRHAEPGRWPEQALAGGPGRELWLRGGSVDVLEHVRDLDAVIRETARVLKPGGLYLFDTINRTGSASWS